jgi:histidine triad (HIT) family protein
MNCIFCDIAAGNQPANIIHSDDDCVAFYDLSPQAPTHFLVIPKTHISTVNDISDQNKHLIGHMYQVAAKIAEDKGFDQSGYRLVMNCNQQGGQTVYHIHLHVLAGRQMSWPPG